MIKKTFEYECARCHKKGKSIDPKKLFCNTCRSIRKPGKNQQDFFGGIVIK